MRIEILHYDSRIMKAIIWFNFDLVIFRICLLTMLKDNNIVRGTFFELRIGNKIWVY